MEKIYNTEDNKELEELRQQMNIVRGKLDATLTLDEKMLQTRIKMEKRHIQNFAFCYTAGGGVAAAIIMYFCCLINALSFGIVLAVLCIVECDYHMYLSRKVKNLGHSSSSMKDAARRLILLKKQLNIFTIIDLCVISPIIVMWGTYIIWTHIIPENLHSDTLLTLLYIFIVVMATLLGIIGEWLIINKQKHNLSKMIDTINEIAES